MEKNKSVYQAAVLVSGPMMDEHWPIHKFLVERVDSVLSIGDGVREITTSPTEGEFYDAINLTDAVANEFKKVLIILSAHGYTKDDEHFLFFGEKYSPSTASIFKDFANIYPNSEIDFFIISCFGGAAVSDIEALPESARVFILSGASEEAMNFNSDATINNFPEGWALSLENIFYNHLLEMSVFEKPALISKHYTLEPFKFYQQKIYGKSIDTELLDHLNDRIVQLCAGKDGCSEKLASALSNFQNKQICHSNLTMRCGYMKSEEGIGTYQLLSLLVQEFCMQNECSELI